MKLRKEMIDYLAHKIVLALDDKGLIDCGDETEDVCQTVSGIITRDLQIEDELNDEVKTMLETMGEEIDRQNVNYRKMFQMVKQKLARERGLIL
ncbi:MAG: DUF507 family protein [Nitrospinae bacterium]|nr:DUF507 family protein [Nitrospinota bacterium]